MRYAVVSVLTILYAFTTAHGKGAAAPARAQPHYRLGKAPKPEFKVAGKTWKIDPEARSTKQVRALPPEHFDPTTRRQRVETFYRETLKERYDEYRHRPQCHCGPFRSEFIYWTEHWPAAARARWAWHHRIYIDEALWAQWMADAAFAAAINALQRQNEPAVIGYLPPEYAAVSPVFVYNDEYLDAVFNPIPFLAVLTPKSLKPDEKTDWIGAATAESLITGMSSVPGLFIAERAQVAGVLRDQKLREPDVADPTPAAQVGKALDVEHVVTGSYVVDGDKVLFNLRIVDVETGAVQSGISKTVSRDHLLEAMPDLAASLAAALGYAPGPESPDGTVKILPDAVASAGAGWSIPPGKWSRKWTIKGGDMKLEVRIQTYTVFDAGARVKAYSWDLPFVPEPDGSLSIEGTHFFQTFAKTKDEIAVREWAVRADYQAGKEPLYIGVFEPIILDRPPGGPVAAKPAPTPPAAIVPGAIAIDPRDQPFDMSDWRVWCWSGKSWSEFPLDKMTVQRNGGTLKAANTTNSNWKRAILLYRSPVLSGDFDVSVEYRGQIESFDLQSAVGDDRHITCFPTAAGDRWHTIKLQRTDKTISASIDGTPVKVNYGKADASLGGFFCIKLQPSDSVELRSFTIRHSK
jgi:TolB-like protein